MRCPRNDVVLFIGVGDPCRRQVAEALVRRHAPGRFEVHSAGLRPAAIHPLTYRVLGELVMDLSGHRPKGVCEFFRANLSPGFAVILCDAGERDCPRLYPGALRVLRWPFADPASAPGGDV